MYKSKEVPGDGVVHPYNRFVRNSPDGDTWRDVLMAIASAVLLIIAVILWICVLS